MNDIFSLKEKTILVTGASSGIGRACAIAVAGAGGRVIISGRDDARLTETSKLLTGSGHESIKVDLANETGRKELIAQLSSLDGVVLAAGNNKIKPAKFIQDSDVDEMFNVNFKTSFSLICAILRAKKIKNSASCVFIGSISTRFTAIGNSLYSASKGALLSGVRTLALETSKQKIRMNVISPGQILTPLIEKTIGEISSDVFRKNEIMYPLGYGYPDDVAYASLYLLSDAARWVTGSDLILDGGFTLT